MSRINLDPLLTFPDGSHLMISTQCSGYGELYSPVMEKDDRAAFPAISNYFAVSTCISVQEYADSYALQLYPSSAETIEKNRRLSFGLVHAQSFRSEDSPPMTHDNITTHGYPDCHFNRNRRATSLFHKSRQLLQLDHLLD